MNWALPQLLNGSEEILEELLTLNDYLLIIQYTCPYLVRYLCMAYIANPRESILRHILQVAKSYKDPIVELFQIMFSSFDFLKLGESFKLASEKIDSDFFLHNFSGKIKEKLVLLCINTLCRIQKAVSIQFVVETFKLETLDVDKIITQLKIQNIISSGKMLERDEYAPKGKDTNLERLKLLDERTKELQTAKKENAK